MTYSTMHAVTFTGEELSDLLTAVGFARTFEGPRRALHSLGRSDRMDPLYNRIRATLYSQIACAHCGGTPERGCCEITAIGTRGVTIERRPPDARECADPILCPRCEGDESAEHNGYGEVCRAHLQGYVRD